MNYNSLKATINANIKQNGNQEITGVVLNSVLNAMVNALASAGATFGGVIDPASSAPVSLDQATIYLALTPGTYTNFRDEDSEPIVVDGIALIQYDGGGTLEFSKTELKPWQMTIVPDVGNDYIGIFVPNGGCTLAVDSIGFHGMICVANSYDIASATFVGGGGGGIDTSVNVQSGRVSTTPVVVLKSNNDTPITITCVAGNAPDRAFGTDEIIITPIATKAWTELGAGGGGVTPVTSWQNPPTDTDVPSEKLVYDSLGKRGVISQTQTWSGSGSQPRTYVMSDLVYGAIPQANIDLFVAAGATFNSVSGYFELNGLTDISYEEMKVIYMIANLSNAAKRSYAAGGFLQGNGARTNIVTWSGTWNETIPANQIAAYGDIESFRYKAFHFLGTGSSYLPSSVSYCFVGSSKLRRIGELNMSNVTSATNVFYQCYSLEEVTIIGLKVSLSFGESPNLSMSSIEYMITNAGTATITITLHSTAYAAAQSDAGVQAALAAKPNVSLASA